jgi:F-type H+-transporting ATPase subunit epsilon
MPREFHLSVVAPDKSVVEEEVSAVVAPGENGYLGVLAGHSPLVAALRPGLVEFTDRTGTKNFVYIGGGFAEVRPDRVTILADEASRANEIDISEAERMLEEARKALRGEESVVNSENAVAEIEKAMNRIRAARTKR